MKIKEEGNYKIRDWSLDVECTGKNWVNKQKLCHSIVTLEDGDIVKRKYTETLSDRIEIDYGFIYCKCHCFTKIDDKLIPQEIKDYCLQVCAKGGDYYHELTEEEKKIKRSFVN